MAIRIPDNDWRIINDIPQISVSFLRKRTRQAARFTQWMQRTHAKLLSAPENVQSCCTSELINGTFPDTNGWLYAGDALALLTYSIYSNDNEPLIEAIERQSGLKLPVRMSESRLEGQFGAELNKLKAFFWDQNPKIYLEVERQKKIGRYCVDFFVTEQIVNEKTKRQFIIEFDEKAHKLKRYQDNDKKRDIWLRKNHPEMKLIRVRHEEQETWLHAIRQLKRLVSLEDCYAHCLRLSCTALTESELRINSDSARKAYDKELNECHFLLKHPTQPLKEMATLLERLGIPYEKRRDIHFKRAYLRSYGIKAEKLQKVTKES